MEKLRTKFSVCTLLREMLLNDSTINHKILNIISNARNIIQNNKSGTNIIRYLFYNINNRIIKEQLSGFKNDKLSD